MKAKRVLLADDHVIVLEGLRRVLEGEFEVVGAVPDGRAMVEAAARLKPDMVVADIAMPHLNGIEATRQIKRSNPGIKVVFMTMHADADYAREALAAGGSAYVLKSSAGEELFTAIREVLRGRTFVSPAIADSVTAALGKQATELARTTSRQREVLQLVAEGRTAKEIAKILHVSPRTVEFHKYRMMRELGVKTTVELTHYAIKHGVVTA